MRRCQKCGTKLRPQAKFCPGCGTRLAPHRDPHPAPQSTETGCVFQEETAVRVPGLPLASRPAGAQRLFGFEIKQLPDWLSAPGVMGSSDTERLTWVLQHWEQLLAQLWKWKGAAVALRFRSQPQTQSVDMAILARVRHPTHSHSISQALARELETQLSAQYLAPQPIADRAKLAQIRDPLSFDGCLLEVRQQESIVPLKFGEAYVVYPFQRPAGDFRMVFHTLSHTASPALLSLYLEPVALTQSERTALAQAASTAQTLADFQYSGEYYRGHWYDPQANLVGTAYRQFLSRLGQPFLCVAHVVSSSTPDAWAIARAVENAVASHRSSPTDESEIPVHCDIVQAADPQARYAIQHSIASLTLSGWEFDRASPGKERLRYLTDSAGAASLFRFPIARPGEVSGITVKQVAPGGAQGPTLHRSGSDEISLGTYVSGGTSVIKREALNRHGLIVGFTGSGKTNTCLHLLQQLWQTHQIPFLVIEPAKTEYRGLIDTQVGGDPLVFTLGDEATAPFRLNPFEILPGVRVEAHLSALKTCFNAALPQFGILPSIIEESLIHIYEEKAWHLTDRGRSEDPRLFPTMRDMYRMVIRTAEERGYAGEVHDNIRAAAGGRIGSLLSGSKGLMFNCQRSLPLDVLLARPTVLELDSLSDNEKALTMMFLLTQLREYCKVNRPNSQLRHITLIEEAHRILEKTPSVAGSEVAADTKAEAVRFFSGALAEIRAYGEGFLIAEQSPSKLAPDAIRNTNLKLAHMLLDAEDRQVIAGSMIMDEEQQRFLGKLPVGQAAVFMTGYEKAAFVQVPYAKGNGYNERLSDERVQRHMQAFRRERSDAYLPFDGCRFCGSPCRFRSDVEPVTRIVELHHAFQRALLTFDERPDPAYDDQNWEAVVQVCRQAAQRAGHPRQLDAGYCYFAHEIDFPFTQHMRDRFVRLWRRTAPADL